MNKAEKKFRIYAILVIFVLLTVLLAVINTVNFTMAAEDADRLTQAISERQGSFEPVGNFPSELQFMPKDKDFRMGPMGPDSPEMNASLRYFTIAFTDKGEKAETVAFNISAVTEEDAREWAKQLLKEKAGWSRGTYRYRVYKKGGTTYVTVIDQGRELLPSYRILIISAGGEALCLIIAWFVLQIISRKIYAPIEEADRKQRNFIKNANKEFRVPLTVISGNTELTERKYGPDDQTRSTRRQIEKMNELVEKLGTTRIFEDEDMQTAEVPVSEYLLAALEENKEKFSSRGVELGYDIAPDIKLAAAPEAVKRIADELVCNALKYSVSKADFTLKEENGHVLIETKNDADLPDGPADQVFDRFTVLQNAGDGENGAGLGLAYVKEVVKAHKGRASAEVKDGTFILRITL
jgi:signal transduction histidine kinase